MLVLLLTNINAQNIPWSQDYQGGECTLSLPEWAAFEYPNGWIHTVNLNNGEDGYNGTVSPHQAKVVRVLMAPGVKSVIIGGTWSHTYSGATLHGFFAGELNQEGGFGSEFEPGQCCESGCSGSYIDVSDESTEMFLYSSFLDDQKMITREELGIPIDQPIWLSYVMYQDHDSWTNTNVSLTFSCNVINEEGSTINTDAYKAWLADRPWNGEGGTGSYDGIAEYHAGEDLTVVGYNVKDGLLTDTKPNMEYQLGESKTWIPCTDGTTSGVAFVEGKVEIRQIGKPSNYREITTLVTPAAPTFSINYSADKTAEIIPATTEYNYDNDFTTGNTLGEGIELDLTPGTNVYFRNLATVTDLTSAIQSLIVSNRPAAPAFTIDYVNETTSENIGTDIAYSYDGGTTVLLGDGTPVVLTPGNETTMFCYLATTTAFASELQNMTIPERPDAPFQSIVNDDEDTFGWQNNASFPNVTDYENTVDNATSWTVCDVNPLAIGDVSIPAGEVQVRVKALANTNFHSDALPSYSAFTQAAGVENLATISIHPNPVNDILNVNADNITTIEIIEISGKIIKVVDIAGNTARINLTDLSKGIYIVKVNFKNSFITKKITKQ